MSDEKVKTEGVVQEALPDSRYRVEIEGGKIINAYLAGKMKIHHIRVMVGDKVAMELSPDGERGRITYRF